MNNLKTISRSSKLVNDKESEIRKVKNGDRTYRVLESIGTKPNVIYQVKIRNTKKI